MNESVKSMRLGAAAVASVATILLAAACSTSAGVPGTAFPENGDPGFSEAGPSLPAWESRFGRERPVVAILTHHEGSEVTDFVVPYGVLSASGAADAITVSTRPGPVKMFPALIVQPEMTTEQFDVDFPDGADYLIVPAVHKPGAPELVGWIRAQAERGATIVGICDGVLVLSAAGLLDGRNATAHWFSVNRLRRRHPDTRWMRHLRYVSDGNVVTTTGVSASVPVSLALVEAIAGTDRATELAATLGIRNWSPAHDGEAFRLRGHLGVAAGNRLAFWWRDTIGIEVEPGIDEISLALKADLWSRTWRSTVRTISPSTEIIRTRTGLLLIPDRVAGAGKPPDRVVEIPEAHPAGSAIDLALDGIARAYGRSTAAFVATQIEYAWPGYPHR